MKLLLSRYISHAKKYFYKSIKERLDSNKLVYIVVPEQFTLGTEIEAYAQLGINATLNLRIKSFKTLINEILHNNGGRAFNFISDSAKFVMIQAILMEVAQSLISFHKNIYDQDFIKLLIKFIDEMTANQISIDQLREFSEKEETSKELKSKLKDIICILEKFNDYKTKSDYFLMDRTDLAIEKLDNMASYREISFYFYRFHDMSKQELEILSKIDKISDFTLVNIVYDKRLLSVDKTKFEDADVFDISSKFINSLRDSQYRNSIEYENIDDIKKFTEIELFLDNLFSYNINKIKQRFANTKLSNIYLTRSNTSQMEVEDLAISIKKDIIEKGYNYRDIAILTTNSGEYFNKIKKNFEINEIPFFIDESRNLIDNSIVRYLKSAINLIKFRLSNQSVEQYLKSLFIQRMDFEINIFSSFIKSRNIFGRMLFDDKYFSISDNQIHYREEDQENLESVLQVRKILLTYLNHYGNIDEIFEDEKYSYQYFTKLFYNFISNQQFFARYSLIKDDLKEGQQDENDLIWQSFVELMDNLYSMPEDLEISLSKYLNLLLAAIDNFKVGIIPPSQDQVIVGDIKRSRFIGVKKIYLLGMTNIYFPVVNKDSDLFLDNEKLEMIESGFEIKSVKSSIASNDLLSFYELLYTASKELVFSYSMIDSSNEAMSAAFILDWVKAMISPENIILEESDYEDFIYSKSMINRYLPSKLIDLKLDELISKEEEDFILNLRSAVQVSPRFDNVKKALNLQDKDESRPNLDIDLIKKIYRVNSFSVSQLEKFRENPFDHFVRYGLKPREDSDFDLSNLDTGNFVHIFLSRSIKEYIVNKDQLDLDGNLDLVAKDVFEEYRLENKRNEYFIKSLKMDSKEYFDLLTKQIDFTKIDRIYFEEKYGDNRTFPAVKIDFDGKEISLEGKIDRVDVYINEDGTPYFRVVDYKTGGKVFDIAKLLHGIDLQLLLYLDAVTHSKKNAKPIGAFYQQVNSKIVEGDDELEGNTENYKNFRLDGIINSDEKIFKILDEDTDLNKVSTSNIHKFYGGKWKFSDKDNVFSDKEFEKLFVINRENIKKSLTDILKGDISLRPYYLNKKSPYEYSNYRTISKDQDLKFEYLDIYNWEYARKILESEDE